MTIEYKLTQLKQHYSAGVQRLQELDAERTNLTQELLQVQGGIEALQQVECCSVEEEEEE